VLVVQRLPRMTLWLKRIPTMLMRRLRYLPPLVGRDRHHPAPSRLREWAGWARARLRECALGQRLPLSASRARELIRSGRHGSRCPPCAAAAGTALVGATLIFASSAAFAQAPPTDAEILALVRTHCVACHAAEPTHEAFAKAPAGVVLETLAQITTNAARILDQVAVTRAMPLGNETGMTDEERDRIAAWIEGRTK
jgi:mono/diheme cytochrome c family protein